MFEDKEVGFAVTRQPHHSAVIVLNPAAHHFPAHQLDGHRRLLLAHSLQVSGLLVRVVGWRSLGLVRVAMIAGPLERHTPILHGDSGIRPVQDSPSRRIYDGIFLYWSKAPRKRAMSFFCR